MSRDRCPEHILDVRGAARQHDEAIESERDAGAFGHAMGERRQEIFVDRIGHAIACLLLRLVRAEAPALRAGIGELAERIGELEAADIELEPLGKMRIAGLRPRERRHGDRIVVKNRRRAAAELRLDALEEDAEEQILPAIAVMRRDAERLRRLRQPLDSRLEPSGQPRPPALVTEPACVMSGGRFSSGPSGQPRPLALDPAGLENSAPCLS